MSIRNNWERFMSAEETGTSSEVSRLFRKRWLSCDEANRLTDLVTMIASEKTIARLEKKMDVQAAEIAANAKVYQAQLKSIKWVIVVSIAVAGVIGGVIAGALAGVLSLLK